MKPQPSVTVPSSYLVFEIQEPMAWLTFITARKQPVGWRKLSYQFLGDSGGSPLIGDGVKGGIFPSGNGISHDHPVPLVNADAVPTFHPGREGRILGVHQQAANFSIVFQVGAQAVVLLAAFA